MHSAHALLAAIFRVNQSQVVAVFFYLCQGWRLCFTSRLSVRLSVSNVSNFT